MRVLITLSLGLIGLPLMASSLTVEVAEADGGAPVIGVEVWLANEDYTDFKAGHTDPGGCVSFDLPPASYHVGLAESEMASRGYILPAMRDVSMGSENQWLRFRLERGESMISGHLTHNGAALAGVFVKLFRVVRRGEEPPSFEQVGIYMTPVDGRFQFSVSSGEYAAQADGHALANLGLAPMPGFIVTAPPAGVGVANLEIPDASATIIVSVHSGERTFAGITTMLNAGGFYLIDRPTLSDGRVSYPVAPGTYDVGAFLQELVAEGVLPRSNILCEVKAGQATLVDFDLRPMTPGVFRDALLRIFEPDFHEVRAMDLNGDERFDVADLVSLVNAP